MSFIITPQSIPNSWKLSIFSSISFPSLTGILQILAIIVLIFISIFLIRKFINYIPSRYDSLVFLELTFPSITSKTAYASEQLFSLIHALASQQKFIQKLVGYKKQYSLEIIATKEQGIRYILVISSENAPIIRKNLLSYLSGLKIREIKDYLPNNLKIKNKYKLTEFKLSNDFVLPLKESKTLDEHDPIAYLTGNMTKLRPDELMVFQAVVTPLTKFNHPAIFKQIKKIQQHIYNNQTLSDKLFENYLHKIIQTPLAVIMFLLKIIATTISNIMNAIVMIWETPTNNVLTSPIKSAKANREEIQNPYELELQEQIKKKIGEPLFETSLRLFISTKDTKQTNLRMSGFLASLSSLRGVYQSLTLNSKGLSTLWQPYLSTFLTRKVSLFKNSVLSASELTDIYHFPYTETTKTEDLVKSKNQQLPAPLVYKQAQTQLDNIFAKNTYGETETIIGQTLEERRLHTYILGATGSGKSTLLSNMIYNDIINGKGVAVLDPHGQLVERIMRIIPKDRIDDVVWFAPDDDGYPISLNLMELPKDKSLTNSQLQKQKSLVASSIISIIEKFYDAKFFGPRMEYVLRNAILTALEIPNSTIKTIVDILTKTKYRKEIVKGLDNEVLKDYWVNEFARLGSLQRNTVISPITNKIGGLLSSPINYNILKQPQSKLNFDNVINSGKILLCDLSKGKIGEDESSFFGSLVIAKIQLAALRRALISEEERRDFFLYVDEFQNFATPTFAELVSEARKYHLATILAHQSISQIENRDIIKIILANVGTVICFKTANPEDEQFILPIFSPEVTKHEIANLPLYNFYMKVSVGQAQDTFLAQADNFTIKGNDETVKAVIVESRKNYATPMNNSTETVSQLIKSPEIQNPPLTEEKPESLNSYPIQYRSKAGNGTTLNNKPPITPHQYQILNLLYRFRFLDRTQIQQFLNHKNHKLIIIWLKDLVNKKLINPITENSKATIYYLTKNSIKILQDQNNIDKSSLQKLYYESNRTPAFISQCMLIASIHLKLQKLTTEKHSYKMFVKSDYYTHPLAELLNDLKPGAYVEERTQNNIKYSFLEVLTDLPDERLRQRIIKYLSFYQNNGWEAETQYPFPTIYIICPTNRILDYIKRYIRTKCAQLDEPNLTIYLTTIDKVKESGTTGDIWIKIR